MTDNGNDNEKVAVSVPVGLIATGILLGLAGITAYRLSAREESENAGAVRGKAKSAKGFGRKMGIMSLITLLENDATRKVVISILKAMARRS